MSVLSQCHAIIIDRGIILSGHGKDVVDGLNEIYRRYMYQLMSYVQFPGSVTFDLQILMHSFTHKNYFSLAR